MLFAIFVIYLLFAMIKLDLFVIVLAADNIIALKMDRIIALEMDLLDYSFSLQYRFCRLGLGLRNFEVLD